MYITCLVTFVLPHWHPWTVLDDHSALIPELCGIYRAYLQLPPLVRHSMNRTHTACGMWSSSTSMPRHLFCESNSSARITIPKSRVMPCLKRKLHPTIIGAEKLPTWSCEVYHSKTGAIVIPFTDSPLPSAFVNVVDYNGFMSLSVTYSENVPWSTMLQYQVIFCLGLNSLNDLPSCIGTWFCTSTHWDTWNVFYCLSIQFQ